MPASAVLRFAVSRGYVPEFGHRLGAGACVGADRHKTAERDRSEEHTSELQSQSNLVCRLLLEKKKKRRQMECSMHSPRSPESVADCQSVLDEDSGHAVRHWLRTGRVAAKLARRLRVASTCANF